MDKKLKATVFLQSNGTFVERITIDCTRFQSTLDGNVTFFQGDTIVGRFHNFLGFVTTEVD